MFSTTTSASATIRGNRARPSSDLRSSASERLFRWRFWKSDPRRLPIPLPSAPGGSTRTTSAPQSANWRTQVGPARAIVRSSTRMSPSGPSTTARVGSAARSRRREAMENDAPGGQVPSGKGIGFNLLTFADATLQELIELAQLGERLGYERVYTTESLTDTPVSYTHLRAHETE